MRRIALLGIVIGFLWSGLAGRSALAETRVALVIGNGAYQQAPPLLNPVNDARGMAVALRRLDFQVEEGIDLDMMAMRKALRDFAQLLDDADVGLVYYAGHALQARGRNYLLPIDANLERESDLIFQAVDLGLVLRLLEESPRTSLVFLDACRNNPLARDLVRSLGRERSQAVGQGLAGVESGIGTLISYATQPDNVALDGKGEHSPFTGALLAHIDTQGLEVRQMLSRVRLTVIDATRHRQVPWDHSSLTGDFYFHPTKPHEDGAAPIPLAATPSEDDVVVWKVIGDSRDPADFEIFLKTYPDSPFAPFASARLIELKGPSAPPDAGSSGGPLETPAAAIRGLDLGSRDPAYFEIFLKTYPDSPFAPFARARLVELGVPLTAPTGVQEAAPLEPTAAEARFAPEIGTLPGAEEEAIAPPLTSVPVAPPVEKSEQLAALPGPAPIETAPSPRPILIPAPTNPAVGRPAPEPTAADQARAAELALGLSRRDWRELQGALNALGHLAGPEDGLPGRWTRTALQAWQQAAGSDPSGYLDGRQRISLLRAAALKPRAVARAAQPPSTPIAARAKDSTPGTAVRDCDRLAGDPTDPQRGDGAVAWRKLDAGSAVAACEAAVRQRPGEPRLEHQYGRALLKAGWFEGAVRWLQAAATRGYGAAQRHVGHLYMTSSGVPRDEAQAIVWYRRAAERGDPGAQYILGMIYAAGRGVARDDAQAVTWLSRAADHGDAWAQYILGWMYKEGRGVERSPSLAALWYRRAAQQGDRMATIALDLMN